MIAVVIPTTFNDVEGLPLVNTDPRREIREIIDYHGDTQSVKVRISRIEVVSEEPVELGNHYHTFNEAFVGIGGGALYTAPANDPTNVTEQTLPERGWRVIVPAHTVHTFVLKQPAVLISKAPDIFIDARNAHEHTDAPQNTHTCAIEHAATAVAV
jgi:hypothetical protein